MNTQFSIDLDRGYNETRRVFSKNLKNVEPHSRDNFRNVQVSKNFTGRFQDFERYTYLPYLSFDATNSAHLYIQKRTI